MLPSLKCPLRAAAHHTAAKAWRAATDLGRPTLSPNNNGDPWANHLYVAGGSNVLGYVIKNDNAHQDDQKDESYLKNPFLHLETQVPSQ